jgi:hypothetical protein
MAWGVSNTMTVEWFRDMVQDFINEYGCPEILKFGLGFFNIQALFLSIT